MQQRKRDKAKAVKTDARGQVLLPGAPKHLLIEPEASVLKRVTQALELAGCCVLRNTVGFTLYMGRGITFGLGKGSADLVCIVPPMGRWLCVELKRAKGGKVSAEQERWIREVRSYGAVAGVARSVDDALALLAEAKWSKPAVGQ